MTTNRDAPGDADGLYVMADVTGLTRFSETHIRAMVRNKTFPAPLKIGRAARWRKADVLKWIEEQRTGPTGRRAGRVVQVRG
jgi:predicted DNA-binding transcriptional regulator AlpA